MALENIQQAIDGVHQLLEVTQMVEISHGDNQQPYINMSLNHTIQQQVWVAGKSINTRVTRSIGRRLVNLENRVNFSCLWVNYRGSRVCVVLKRLKDVATLQLRPAHSYGLVSNGGPQSTLIVRQTPGSGQPDEELLYIISERTAEMMAKQLYDQQIIHKLIDAFNKLINAGIQLYQTYLDNYIPNVDLVDNDNQRQRFCEVATRLRYLLHEAMSMEEVLTHAVEYTPQALAIQVQPIPVGRPAPLNLQPWLPEFPTHISSMNEFEGIKQNVENNRHRLYQINWMDVFNRYAHRDHSIVINKTGNQVLKFADSNQVIHVFVNIGGNHGIELRSTSFLTIDYKKAHTYYIRTVSNRQLIYKSPKLSEYIFQPVYSYGNHGEHVIVGLNGWHTMVLQFKDIGPEERVYFVNYRIARKLRRLFEVWDVMTVYRQWFVDLIRYASLLIEMQRFANQNVQLRQDITIELIKQKKWLAGALPRLFTNYHALEKLQLLHRHSILIADPNRQLPRDLVLWPSKNEANNLDVEGEDESDADDNDAGAYWGVVLDSTVVVVDDDDGAYGGADPNDPINLLVPTNLLTQIEPIGPMDPIDTIDPIDPMDFINPIGHDPMIYEGAVGHQEPAGNEHPGTRSQDSPQGACKRRKSSTATKQDPQSDDKPN